ncbi:hypothetical protein NL676_008358 [Syzygium grande]|nr:hypothetical protein NL676_008358 [Syzygium grande]
MVLCCERESGGGRLVGFVFARALYSGEFGSPGLGHLSYIDMDSQMLLQVNWGKKGILAGDQAHRAPNVAALLSTVHKCLRFGQMIPRCHLHADACEIKDSNCQSYSD